MKYKPSVTFEPLRYRHPVLDAGYRAIRRDGVCSLRSRNKCGMTKEGMMGFTLIELSIVLVIIGLIIGGILVGRELIKAGEIRKTIAEMDKVTVAANHSN